MLNRYEQINKIAKLDENIRAVVLYGSRVNDDINSDEFQDYDIIFIVNNIKNFDISVFDDISLIFCPSEVYPEMFADELEYLMLFSDYSRIDLCICTLETFNNNHNNGQLMKCLLDKDNTINGINTNDKTSLHINQIDEIAFNNTCSEFFWEVQNMVKGIKRDELSYMMFIRDISLREPLNRIIDEYIGMNNNYKVSVGTLGKYRKKYLSNAEYTLYEKTYSFGTFDDIWSSLTAIIEMFGIVARKVAVKHGFNYPVASECFVIEYINAKR